MKTQAEDRIPFPRALVFATFRDAMPQLARHLPNITSIEPLERELLPNGDLRAVSLWKASAQEVPALLRPFMKPELTQWRDHALWRADQWVCEWRSELFVFQDQVEARGRNVFLDEGDQTRVLMEGEVKIDGRRLPGGALLGARLGEALESFVVRMIGPNLTQANRALERYLRESG
jgi:hypothetical protein